MYRTERWNWKLKGVDESHPYLSKLAEKLQDKICTIFFSHFFLLPRNVCRYPKLLVSREKMHFCQKHCYTLDVSDTSVFDFLRVFSLSISIFLGLGCATEKKSFYPSDMHFFAIALNCIDIFMMWCYCQYRLIMIHTSIEGRYIHMYSNFDAAFLQLKVFDLLLGLVISEDAKFCWNSKAMGIHLQGVSHWNLFFELALKDRRTNTFLIYGA